MDDEFEDLLAKTRPYLLRLANASVEGRFCRAWLERLNKARDQRRLRNEHLAELLDQLERGHLKLPFDKMPPKHGRLVPIPRYDRYKQAPPPAQEVPHQQQQQQQVTSSSCTELTTEETGSVVVNTPAVAPPPQPVIPQSTSIPIATSKRSKSRHRASVSAGYVVAHSPSPNRSRLADNDDDDDDASTLVDAPPIQSSTVAGGDTSHPLPPSRSAATPRAATAPQPPQTTTTTTTVHFCEQSVRAERNATRTYRERIETMSSIIEDLEAQNEKLREKLNYYHDCSQAKSEIPQLHAKIKKFVNEIATLRAKLLMILNFRGRVQIGRGTGNQEGTGDQTQRHRRAVQDEDGRAVQSHEAAVGECAQGEPRAERKDGSDRAQARRGVGK
ncbi:unnamed protein product [Trichogramma brassicae]|uniref:DUF4485 domain-containing protein n=1 Tax=Trichogramma brassicae TaxID=86971 RepID=A0A6H5IZC7_9HYME|nr:unnamed protein product [Trichogramma brassicae]